MSRDQGSAIKTRDSQMLIPRILHQTWRNEALPPRFARWSQSWRHWHPDWDYRFYTDEDIRKIIRDRAPRWLPAFDSMTLPVLRIDFFRYVIVYLDGGLYADLDMIAYKPSDALLSGASCVLSVEHELTRSRQRALNFAEPFQLANCIFAAVPRHPFLSELIEEIVRNVAKPVMRDADVLERSGPYLVTRMAFTLAPSRRGSIKVLPQIHWMPPREYPRIGPLGTNIYARHIGSGTWRAASSLSTLWTHLREWNRWPSVVAPRAPKL